MIITIQDVLLMHHNRSQGTPYGTIMIVNMKYVKTCKKMSYNKSYKTNFNFVKCTYLEL